MLCTSNVNVNPGRIRMVGVSDVLSGKAPVFFFYVCVNFLYIFFCTFCTLARGLPPRQHGHLCTETCIRNVCLLPQVCANVV